MTQSGRSDGHRIVCVKYRALVAVFVHDLATRGGVLGGHLVARAEGVLRVVRKLLHRAVMFSSDAAA